MAAYKESVPAASPPVSASLPPRVCIVAIPTKREEFGRLRRRWPWRGVSSGRAFSSRRGRRSRWSGRSCLGRWASPQPLRSLITLSGAQCNDATSMILGAAFERRWSTRRRRSGRVVEEEWMATRRALPKIAECACVSCSSLQSQRICGGYWRWSDGTRALRATATFAQRRHHGRGRLECWYRLGCEAVEGMGRHRRVVAQGSGLREVRLDEVVP